MKLNTVKKVFKYTIGSILIIAILWVCNFLIIGNFHKVDNNVYRSAQLFSFNMPYYVEKNNIKSIINLRGPSQRDWYKYEKEFSKKSNIKHYDFGFSDRKVQSIEKMTKLVELIKNAPKPLLIHCKAGADRASLASALYLLGVKNDFSASDQISLKFGHFPWLGSKTNAMDKSFEKFSLHKLLNKTDA